MSGISFVSSLANEKEKQRKKEARLAVLEKARRQYEVDAEKADRQKAQGVDSWLSPAFSARLEAEKRVHGGGDSDSDPGKKKKKSKKQKKEKHKKKRKKEKKSHSSGESSGSDSDEPGDKWVDPSKAPSSAALASQPGPSAPVAVQERDSWMLGSGDGDFFSGLGRRKGETDAERKRKEEAEAKKTQLDVLGQHPLELNKHWKDGGTGLPPEEEQAQKTKAVIGDGGKSWIRRAYQRAVEQARREGRPLEEVAAERWGSLEKLHSLLDAADGISSRYGDSRGRRGRGGGEADGRQRRRRSPPSRHDDDGGRAAGARGGFQRPPADEDRPRSSFRRPDDSDSGRGRSDFKRPDESRRDFKRPDESRRDFKRPDESRRASSPGRDRHRDHSASSDRSPRRHPSPPRHGRGGEERRSQRHSRSPSRSLPASDSPRRKERGDSPPRRAHSNTTTTTKPHSTGHGGSDRLPHLPTKTSAAATSSSSTAQSSSSASAAAAAPTGEPAPAAAAAAPPEAEKRASAPPVTEAQLNTLGAKIVKAELMGNKELAARLQSKLTMLRERKKEQDSEPAEAAAEHVESRQSAAPSSEQRHRAGAGDEDNDNDDGVLLMRTDRQGNTRPAMAPDEDSAQGGGRRRQKKVATHTDGQRERYFANDDKFSLSELVARERLSTAEDVESALHRMSGRFVEKTNDDDYTLDDMYVSRAARKQRDGREEEQDMRRAMTEHRRSTAAADRCHLCMDGEHFRQNMVISMGMKVYLSIPDYAPMTDGHCILATTDHSLSTVAIDEEVVQEIRVFQKGLVAMYKEQDEDVVFLETCFLRRRRHMFIECIPVPKEIGDMAPIYFKKAIQDSGEEWSENKKLIDTREKGLRRSIPPGFSYFSVEFGLDGGFAHAIEDDESFSPYFGKEIVGGILDADALLWRKPRRLGPAEQKRKVMNFSKMWEPFDWTKSLQS